MNIKELRNYTFHDSEIININFENDKVILNLEYLMYMQNDYKEEDPEMAIAILTFNGVEEYINTHKKFDYDEILELKIDDNICTFIVIDSGHEVYSIKIKAKFCDFSFV